MLQKGFQVSRVKMPAGDPNHGKDAVLVFTIELVRIFVTINRVTIGSLCSLLFAHGKPAWYPYHQQYSDKCSSSLSMWFAVGKI